MPKKVSAFLFFKEYASSQKKGIGEYCICYSLLVVQMYDNMEEGIQAFPKSGIY